MMGAHMFRFLLGRPDALSEQQHPRHLGSPYQATIIYIILYNMTGGDVPAIHQSLPSLC